MKKLKELKLIEQVSPIILGEKNSRILFENKAWFWLALIVVGIVLTRTLTFGFSFDQGILEYSAWAGLNGRWPITDTWDTTFPGGILLHMLVLSLGGTSPLAFRAFDLVIQLFNLLILFNLVKKLANLRAGFLAVVLYANLYASSGQYQTAQRDSFIVPLLLLAIWGTWKYLEKPNFRQILLVGGSFGLICLIRPTYFPILIAFVLYLLVLKYRFKKVVRWSAILLIFALCSFPIIIFLLLYTLRGDFQVLVDLFSYIAVVYPNLERSNSLDVIISLVQYAEVYLLVGAFLFLFSLREAIRNSNFLEKCNLLAVALLSCLSIRLLESKTYLYQYWPVLAILAVYAGVGFDFGLTQFVRLKLFPEKRGKWVALAFTILLALSIISSGKNLLKDYQDFIPKLQKSFSTTPFYQNLVADSLEQATIANYLHDQTQPGDYIQLWGPEINIYYASGRFAASRYVDIMALLCSEKDELKLFTECDKQKTIPAQQVWKQRYIEDINKNRPRYIVVHYENSSLAIQSSFAFAPDFPELRELIDKDYELAATFGIWSVFELK